MSVMSSIRVAIVALAALSLAACGINSVPAKEEVAKAKWADVQSAYQRRADLIPNLVATVKGAAASETQILTNVTEARNQVSLGHRFLDHYLPAHPDRAAFHAQDAEINRSLETLQRTLLKPRPFHFVLRPEQAK